MMMEFTMNSNLGAYWLPAFEDAGSTNISLIAVENQDGNVTKTAEYRRKLASELLQALESSKKEIESEPDYVWLEEPMDLEIFGQSLEGPLIAEDDGAFYADASPPSPASTVLSPIQPASPVEFHQPPLSSDKCETVLVDSDDLLYTLEQLLAQTDADRGRQEVEPEVSLDEDGASALLDSFVIGAVHENQVINDLAEFSQALMDAAEVERTSESGRSTCSSESDDTEWLPTPKPVAKANGAQQRRTARTPVATTTPARTPRQRKSRTKNEDRRLRKKEQNKTAATRYRIKKKVEMDLLMEEEAQLECRNKQLQSTHDELANEIRYLKKLMREMISGRLGKRR